MTDNPSKVMPPIDFEKQRRLAPSRLRQVRKVRGLRSIRCLWVTRRVALEDRGERVTRPNTPYDSGLIPKGRQRPFSWRKTSSLRRAKTYAKTAPTHDRWQATAISGPSSCPQKLHLSSTSCRLYTVDHDCDVVRVQGASARFLDGLSSAAPFFKLVHGTVLVLILYSPRCVPDSAGIAAPAPSLCCFALREAALVGGIEQEGLMGQSRLWQR